MCKSARWQLLTPTSVPGVSTLWSNNLTLLRGTNLSVLGTIESASGYDGWMDGRGSGNGSDLGGGSLSSRVSGICSSGCDSHSIIRNTSSDSRGG